MVRSAEFGIRFASSPPECSHKHRFSQDMPFHGPFQFPLAGIGRVRLNLYDEQRRMMVSFRSLKW
jgi:hypothetical protein